MKAEIRLRENGDAMIHLESQTALEMDALRILEEQNAARGIYIASAGSSHGANGAMNSRMMNICPKPNG